jgi:acyl dehydratase
MGNMMMMMKAHLASVSRKHWMLQVRFAKHVFPGETLLVEMWAVSPSKVAFQTRVKERNAVAISNAAVEFQPGRMQLRAGGLSKL